MSPLYFTSFHSSTTQLPFELTSRIIQYAAPSLVLPGQPGASHPPVAYVSKALRSAYLSQKSTFDFGLGSRPLSGGPVYPGETLSFPDLKTLTQFFTTGPGIRDAQSIQHHYLAHITFVRIVYIDNWAASKYWNRPVTYAYEAFELLVANLDRMPQLRRLQLCIPGYSSFNIDSPGMWSLLKIRGLKNVIISAARGLVPPAVRSALRARLCWSQSRPWSPLGFEDPGPSNWLDRAYTYTTNTLEDRDENRRVFLWLEQRYKFKDDRKTIQTRLQQQRKSRDRLYGVKRKTLKRRHWVRTFRASMKRRIYTLQQNRLG